MWWKGDVLAAVKRSQLLELPAGGNLKHQGTEEARILSVCPSAGSSGRSRCDMKGRRGGGVEIANSLIRRDKRTDDHTS